MALNFKTKLGRRIKAYREQTGLSQENLAKKLEIERTTLSQIENGHRSVTAQEAATFSRIFNITSDVLLDLQKDISVVLGHSTKSTKKTTPKLRISVPQKNLSKFREVILYILDRVGSKPNVGESVLYKLLYFIDFDYYEKYEEQFIGATYIKNHYGPTPKEFTKIVSQMEGKDLMTVNTKFYKYPQTKYLPLREPDMSKLNARELHVINSVIERLSGKNANEISAYSHGDVPWLTAEDGQVIKYESVFYRSAAYSVRSYDEEDIQ